MTVDKYKKIFDDFLSERSTVEVFIEQFITQWKADRDRKREQ
jgi:hypothetical protein